MVIPKVGEKWRRRIWNYYDITIIKTLPLVNVVEFSLPLGNTICYTLQQLITQFEPVTP